MSTCQNIPMQNLSKSWRISTWTSCSTARTPAQGQSLQTWKSKTEKHPFLGNPCQHDQFSLLDLIHPEVYCGLRVTTLKPTVYKNQEKGMVKNQLQWFSFTCKACLFKSLRNAKFYTAKLVFCMKASEYISFLILLNYIFFHTKAHSVNL